MSTTMDPLRLRAVMGKKVWSVPKPFGPDGWEMIREADGATVIVSAADHNGVEYIHASIAHPDRLPTYGELVQLHRAAFGEGYAYQVFPPPRQHVNIHSYALHLWGRSDGKPVLPEFAQDSGKGYLSI